jgi:hypothetical protein
VCCAHKPKLARPFRAGPATWAAGPFTRKTGEGERACPWPLGGGAGWFPASWWRGLAMDLVEEHYGDLGLWFWGSRGGVAHQSKEPHGSEIQPAWNGGDGAVRWFVAASDGMDVFTALGRGLRAWWLDWMGTRVSCPWRGAQRSGWGGAPHQHAGPGRLHSGASSMAARWRSGAWAGKAGALEQSGAVIVCARREMALCLADRVAQGGGVRW